MVFNQWFGSEDLSKAFSKEINDEIKELDNLLNQSIKYEEIIETKERFDLLSKLIEKRGSFFSKKENIFSINLKLKKFIDDIISGDEELEEDKDFFKFILIHQMHKELDEENMWKDLANLFSSEKDILEKLIKNETDVLKKELIKVYKKQKKIINRIKIISEAELNETHTHFNMSVDVNYHWLDLKKFWEKDKNNKPYTGIIKIYDEFVTQKKLLKNDVNKLKDIMKNYFNKKYNDYKAMIEFEKLLFMNEKTHGEFNNFLLRCNLLEPMHYEAIEEHEKNYFKKQLMGIARHYLNKNAKQVEIRYPIKEKDKYYFFAQLAKEVEEEIERDFNKKINIRFIIYTAGFGNKEKEILPEDVLKKTIEEYKEFCKEKEANELKKYFVGFDDNNMSILAKTHETNEDDDKRRATLPVAIHAGEFFSPKDKAFGFSKNRIENVRIALTQIRNALDTTNIKRIGHGNILGINIKEYLKKEYNKNKENKEIIDNLENDRIKLLHEMDAKKIFIEINPSSNMAIMGLKSLEEHPVKLIDEFNEQNKSEPNFNGIKYSINTDDRIIFNTNLRKEFYQIAKAMKWKNKKLKEVIKNTQEAKL